MSPLSPPAPLHGKLCLAGYGSGGDKAGNLDNWRATNTSSCMISVKALDLREPPFLISPSKTTGKMSHKIVPLLLQCKTFKE